jgi:hypothetical protein
MSEQYKPNIGELCTEDARRDAIHIAIAPVVASMTLDPGDHVWLTAEGQAAKRTGTKNVDTVGVVDPFYDTVVLKGEKFWLFLYPNSITNLRHVWEHPAFKAKVPWQERLEK